MEVVEQIAARNDVRVCQLLRSLPVQKDQRDRRRNWSQFIFEQEILQRVPKFASQERENLLSSASSIFEMYKSGYGQIQ